MMRVVWSIVGKKSYAENILYLREFWSKKEAKKFMDSVNKAIDNISRNPYIGSVSQENYNYRKYLVVEQIYLYYRITSKNEILLASFWNNFQDPEKLQKFLT